ncbi:MAG: hypothetical protein J7530_08030 [Novosphingobium sp.]|nr:hypothetical protein [Novosphingobium sp.]
MKVTLDGGQVIDLAITEATPTIGIIDYSRRVTDDYGVTTVVQRDFARRLSSRLVVPSAVADTLQRNLVRLRATAAQWTAVAGSPWLDFRGFYKEFEIDLATPTVSYCTLTVESLAGSEVYTETGIDPAPSGVSILQLLQPAAIGDAALIASNLPENDYPEWSAAATYGLGARVIKAATHRIYESAAVNNVGNDPVGISGKWRDLGPTNRWAMFDQALGSVATAAGEISVTLSAGQINAVAVLDTTATAVRVQAEGYDRTIAPNASGTATLLDLPLAAGNVTITITGPGTIEAGTLLVGRLVGLGETEEGPKTGINDYSVKETDDFGEVKVVERAWAKRMSVRSKIRTDALDIVASRIASVRARPSLWIGKDGLDTLTIYGFFRDFTIERDVTISTLALTVEGLSTAGKVEPMAARVDWPDVQDPLGTKPEDNATLGAPVGTPVAGRPAEEVVGSLDQLEEDAAAAATQIEGLKEDGDAIRVDLQAAQEAIAANGEGILAAQQTLGEQGTTISQLQAVAENTAGSLAQLLDTVTAGSASVSQQLHALQTADDAFASSILAGAIKTGEQSAAFSSEKTIRRNAEAVIARLVDQAVVAAGNAEVGLTQEAILRAAADEAIGLLVTSLSATVNGNTISISQQSELLAQAVGDVVRLYARNALLIEAGNLITGFENSTNGEVADFAIRTDRFRLLTAIGAIKQLEVRQGTVIGYYPTGQKMYQLGEQSVA